MIGDRMNEHQKNLETNYELSQIYQHVRHTRHTFDLENVDILQQASHPKTRKLIEAFYSKIYENSINRSQNVPEQFLPLIRTIANER